MSIEGLNQFQNEVMQDSALQEQFKAAAATSPESLGDLAVKLGAERGYTFTLEEIQAAAAQELSDAKLTAQELSYAELESVAGGGVPFVDKAIEEAVKIDDDAGPGYQLTLRTGGPFAHINMDNL